jgi:hypothetical protein
MRRLTSILVAFCAAVAALVLAAAPAQAHDDWWGDVENHVSSNWPVHIASFGSGGQWCPDQHTNTTYECARYWLPSGKTDSDIKGVFFDADAVMVETTYDVDNHGTFSRVSGGMWWKIGDNEHASCHNGLYRPLCTITWK